MDKSNYDRFKGENFVETLSYRLNNLINYDQNFVGAEHVLLVDNKSQFNIPELKQIISEIADVSKTQTKISLHSHKVEYFRSSAEELREFFGKFIANKLATISDIVKIAENNVVRFQNTIQVINNGLTNFWSEKLRLIESTRISAQKDIHKPHTLPASLHKVSQDILRYDDLRKKIIQQAEERNVEIKTSLTKEIKSCLKSDLLNLSQKIDNISFGGSRNLSQVEFEVSRSRSKKVIEKLDLVPPLQMKNDAKNTWAKVNGSVFHFHKELKNRGRELEENLKDQKPVRAYDRYLESATENLSNDFDTFFESIRVYHAGMFSLGVRSAISTLGLGEKFDLLDNNELTEEEKTARKREAQEHVFVDKSRAFSHFPNMFSVLEARCKAVAKNVVSLSSSTPINPKLPEEADMKDRAATELAILADKVESKLSDFERNINIELRTLFTKISEEWKKEVIEVRQKRRERFVFTSAISTIIGIAGYLLFLKFQNINLSDNISVLFAFGVLVNLFTNAIGFLLARMKSDLPELFSKKERMLIEIFRSESLSIVGDAIDSFEPFPDGDKDFHQQLWLEILFAEPFEEWQKNSTVFYEKLKEISEEYNAILDDYDEIIEESSDVASRYFSNPEDNLDKLQEISDALKATAIEPSFALLAATQKELETVKTRIQEVSFT